MAYTFYANSEKVWGAMYRAMRRAKQSIYLQMYIFYSDTVEYDFLSLLAERAREGVAVKLILDYFGSLRLGKKNIEFLRDAGVEILFSSRLLHRMHKKVLVIDEDEAFIGGANIHQSSSGWKDLTVRATGKTLVKYVAYLFARDYFLTGGKDESMRSEGSDNMFKRTQRRLFEHIPAVKNFQLQKLYNDRLSKAEREVILVTPYFMPSRTLLAQLHQAVLRGVRVIVLVPKSTEDKIIDKANLFYLNRAHELGVTVLLGNSMNHAKAMLIDDSEAIIGSQNLDFLSFRLNEEMGLVFKNPATIRKLREIIDEWKLATEPFDPERYHPSLFNRILARILNFLVSLL